MGPDMGDPLQTSRREDGIRSWHTDFTATHDPPGFRGLGFRGLGFRGLGFRGSIWLVL